MDLNELYARHQVALMRASSAVDQQARTKHLAKAASLAQTIEDLQRQMGAAAADMWD